MAKSTRSGIPQVVQLRDLSTAAQNSLQAQVNQMEVALAQSERNLTYSYIRAPFAGYVAERNLDTGAYVSSATARSPP